MVAGKFAEAFASTAKQGNTMILPGNAADIARMAAAAMQVVKKCLNIWKWQQAGFRLSSFVWLREKSANPPNYAPLGLRNKKRAGFRQ